jgi:DNA/RNA-binding domain of Phe-tRNA-synthetase-like protein
MLLISASENWRVRYPGAIIGILELTGVDNRQPSPRLDGAKRQVESRLRQRYQGFNRPDFLRLPVMAAYERYYRGFEKTYHVLLQLESIVLKCKGLPGVSPLVDANFMAEVETLVLTAGHDAARLAGEIVIDVSAPGERMLQMNGADKALLPGDMLMRDAQGICCSILYGQDNRSPISVDTKSVLYVSYAPPGVGAEAVASQLDLIEANVRLFASQARVAQRRLIEA